MVFMTRRGFVRGWVDVAAAAPWVRAPLLLVLYSRGVLLAVAGAMVVLVAASSSGVLFLASTRSASLHSSASAACLQQSQPAITNSRTATQEATPQQTAAGLAHATPIVTSRMRAAGLPGPDVVVEGQIAVPVASGADPGGAMLFARAGALSHVQVVHSAGGSGVWVPLSFASAYHVAAGSMLMTGTDGVRVAGIYRDLAPSAFVPLFTVDRYWCSWSDQIVPTPFDKPPPFFLTDIATITGLAPTLDATWYAPINVATMTVPQTQAALDATNRALAASGLPDYRVTTELPDMITTADRVHAGLRGPVVPIAVAGVVVSLLLVAGAGQFWALRRRSELRLLASRGISPMALGLKAMLEMLPAVLVGAIAGWGLSIALVTRLGPSPLLEPGAPLRALGLVGAGAVLGLILVTLVGAVAAVTDRRANPRRLRLGHVPWELALLLAAALAYWLVRRQGAVHVVRATVQINALLFAFPLLALTGTIVLIARGVGSSLPALGWIGDRLPAAGYLALRRISGTPVVAVGVLVGVALPCGVLIYASALTNSSSSDVRAKYETNVGAPHAFGTLAAPASTPNLRGHGTIVSVFQNDVANTTQDGTPIQALGIDPTTFTEFAYEGAKLRPLIAQLTTDGRNPAPALLINATAGLRVTALHLGTSPVAVTPVATRASFPGLRDGFEPMLVVNRAALTHVDRQAERVEELWTTPAALTPALAALTADKVDANYQITTNTFLDNSGLRPVTWMFTYLQALAALIGLVSLTGLTLALAARTKQRALAYHMSIRMGLTPAQDRRSLFCELGLLLAAGWSIGLGAALAAVGTVYNLTDVYRGLPPPPTFPLPVTTISVSLASSVLLLFAAVITLHRLSTRAQPSTLLRE